MSKKRVLAFLIMVLLSLNFISCGDKKGTSSEQNKTGNNSSNQGGNASDGSKIANAPVPTKFTKVLVGKIDKYEITMNLTREGEELSGDYQYDNKINSSVGAGVEGLSLKGKVSNDNSFTLEEVDIRLKEGDLSEKVTGIFTGSLVAEQRGSSVGLKVNGDWTNADKSKKLNFFLAEERFSVGENTKIVDKELKEENKKIRLNLNLIYPQIEGSPETKVVKVNEEITKLVNDAKKSFAENIEDPESNPDLHTDAEMSSYYEMSYLPQLINKDVVSLKFLVNSYYLGAAHPNGEVLTFNYSLKTGGEMVLENLFIKDSDYANKITSLCKKSAGGKAYEIFFSDNPKENLANWTISSKGINFYFGVAHVFGDVATVFIPYSEIKDIIDPSSPIAALIKP
jgi:hypothetical protein